jgi:hypothetical protein
LQLPPWQPEHQKLDGKSSLSCCIFLQKTWQLKSSYYEDETASGFDPFSQVEHALYMQQMCQSENSQTKKFLESSYNKIVE